jgi:hypothetical protein
LKDDLIGTRESQIDEYVCVEENPDKSIENAKRTFLEMARDSAQEDIITVKEALNHYGETSITGGSFKDIRDKLEAVEKDARDLLGE